MVGLGLGESGLTMLDQDALGNPPKSWFRAVAPPVWCACSILQLLAMHVWSWLNWLLKSRWFAKTTWFEQEQCGSTRYDLLQRIQPSWSSIGCLGACEAFTTQDAGPHWICSLESNILIYFAHHGAVQIIFVQVCRPSRRFTLWK